MRKYLALVLAILVGAQAPTAFAWKGFSGYREQVDASDIDTHTSNFNSNLSSSDNTVQKALDTLDDLVASGGGISSLAAIGASPNANGATLSGVTLNLEPASDSFGGVVTTGAQTFAGAKTVTDTFTHLQTASAGNTVVDGLALVNNTTASSGNQMYSGALHWKGNGWRTGAGGVSTTAEYRSYILPVQSSTAAETTLVFEGNQNGAGWSSVMQLRLNSSVAQALFEFGTVALPPISFRVDPDTGIRRSGTNALTLVAGGADIAGIDVNSFQVGTLGINGTQFAVHPSAGSKHGAVWRARNATTADYFNFQNDSGTQEGSLFRSNASAGKWSLRLNGNSASTPAYSYYGDEDSGHYTIGSNNVGLSIGGTLRIDWTTTEENFSDGYNIKTGATTGTKIGTATTQKLGFYGATPIVQGASVADATGGVVIDAEARTAINDLISRIEATGLIATV